MGLDSDEHIPKKSRPLKAENLKRDRDENEDFAMDVNDDDNELDGLKEKEKTEEIHVLVRLSPFPHLRPFLRFAQSLPILMSLDVNDDDNEVDEYKENEKNRRNPSGPFPCPLLIFVLSYASSSPYSY
jgi:hypothetical protein